MGPEPPPWGGMAVQGDLLARKLRQSGLSVRRVATNPSLGYIERVRYVRGVVGHLIFLVLLIRAVVRADVVHVLSASWFYFFSRTVPAILVARLLGRRALLNYRGGGAEPFLVRYGPWATFFVRRAHVLMVPSLFLSRVFVKHGLSPVIVPNIADLERFPFHPRPGIAPRLLVNRNLEAPYNVSLTLDALARIQKVRPDATLTIASAGSLEASLRAHTARLGLRGVTFRGAVANVDMPGIYEAHDVYLNPTNVDNMPISLLESMSAGLAIVSTNVGGIPDLMTNGDDCLLVPPGDPDAMASAVLMLLNDASLAERLTQAAARKASRFSWEGMCQQLLRVYAPPFEDAAPGPE